jgi:hypothetical protein
MTMHRRPVGSSRRLAAIGALVALAGCFLPWWTFGGRPGEVSAISGNAFEGFGILVFAACIATLALVTLPYASERPVSFDRWSSYALIIGAGWLGFGYRLVELLGSPAFKFAEPSEIVLRMPGLWLVLIGMIILARAVYEMLQEPRLR